MGKDHKYYYPNAVKYAGIHCRVCRHADTGELFLCQKAVHKRQLFYDCQCAEIGRYLYSCRPTEECERETVYRIDKQKLEAFQKLALRYALAGTPICRLSRMGISLTNAKPFFKDGVLDIPEPISGIRQKAVWNLSQPIKVLKLPPTVGKIDERIFAGQSITEIHFAEGARYIDMEAFCFCEDIKRIYLPKTGDRRNIVRHENHYLKNEVLQRAFEGCTFYVYKDSFAEEYVRCIGVKFKFVEDI